MKEEIKSSQKPTNASNVAPINFENSEKCINN